jgi:hypothetical protein
MDVLLEGGPRHQHWVRLPDPLPDVLVEDTGEYVRMGDTAAYVWVGDGLINRGNVVDDHVIAVVEHDPNEGTEHIRPAPRARTHAPEQGQHSE